MRTFLFLTAIAAAACETGCTPVRAYHLDQPVLTLPSAEEDGCPQTSGYHTNRALPAESITLAYVEFDDNGEMYDKPVVGKTADGNQTQLMIRPELDQTIAAIKKLQNASPGGIRVVLFIHGWKNNADNTSNVAGFRCFLNDIYRSYADRGSAQPLMGIYVGWRGEEWTVAQDLTFLTRSEATLRVAGPHLEEALYRIIRTVKAPPPPPPPPPPAPGPPREGVRGTDVVVSTESPHTLILIGHSFGGRVMERAMTSYWENTLLAHDGDHDCLAKPASASAPDTKDQNRWTLPDPAPDLTVLLNEAAPATDAKQFLEFLRCHSIAYHRDFPNHPDASYPLFLSITSEGDSATSVALPLGQTLAHIGMRTRNYNAYGNIAADPPEIPNQGTYFSHSTANIPALNSHIVRTEKDMCANGETEEQLALDHPVGYHFCQVPLQKPVAPLPLKPYWNHTPYWVAKIPVAIVPDHSNIFRPQLNQFLDFFLPAPRTAAQRQQNRMNQRITGR